MTGNFYVRLVIVFCLINGVGIAYSHVLEDWGIINYIGAAGNLLLAGASAVSYYFNEKAINVQSNHAFVRFVYVSVFIKLIVCLLAVVAYVIFYRPNITVGTILLFFFLYILYSALETASLYKLSKTRSS